MTVDVAQDHQVKPPVQSGLMQVRLSRQLRDAIGEAATARGMTASAWVRQAATTCAVLEGVLFPDMQSDGKRRYARIEGGAIVDVAYLADIPTPQDEPR